MTTAHIIPIKNFCKFFICITFAFLLLLTNDKSAMAAVVGGSSYANTNINSGLIGWWTFDGKDVTDKVYDRSCGLSCTSGNNGYYVGLATSSVKSAGKIGQSLNFNGSSSYVRILNNTGIANLSTYTISAWFKTTSTGSEITIYNERNSGNSVPLIRIGVNRYVSGDVFFEQHGDSGEMNLNSSAVNANNGQWHHIVAVRNGSSWYLYLDRVLVASNPSNSIGATTLDTFNIGRENARYYFPGSIDDVRVWNRAMTLTEVKQIYSANAYKVAVSSLNPGSLDNGLVAYWTFDGKEIANGVAKDKVSGSLNGIMSNIASSTFYVPGKIGQGLKFDGVDDSVKITSVASTLSVNNDFSVSMWFKAGSDISTMQNLLSSVINGNDRTCIAISGASIRLGIYPGYYVEVQKSIEPGKWYHLVMVKSGSTVSGYLNMDSSFSVSGSIIFGTLVDSKLGANVHSIYPYKGYMDDVRIYNRALSNQEVRALYEKGASSVGRTSTVNTNLSSGLVGHWTLDGKDVTDKIYDRSCGKSCTTGYNVYFEGAATSSAKVPGKIGQAMRFDGVNDFINIDSIASVLNTGPVTFSGWIKLDTAYGNGSTITPIFRFGDANSNNDIALTLGNYGTNATDGKLTLSVYNGSWCTSAQSTKNSWLPNVWYFVAGTYKDNDYKVYVNGVQDGTVVTNCARGSTPYSVNFRIADSFTTGGGRKFFKGSIDDPHVYNRVLSADEILKLYNMGR